jgi:hypothetical protein
MSEVDGMDVIARDQRCPKCGKPSVSPPDEVYCLDCATEGWEQDTIAHLRHQLAGAVAESERLRREVADLREVNARLVQAEKDAVAARLAAQDALYDAGGQSESRAGTDEIQDGGPDGR